MRIALTITELHPGGAETCLVHLAEYLKSQGNQVKVWQLWPDPPADKGMLTDRLNRAAIPWSSGDAVHAWDFPQVALWLRKELAAFAPEVVQSFLFHANVATAFAARSLDAVVFGGVRVKQPQRIRWWLQRLASRRMQQLICVSQSVAEHCRQVEGIPTERIEVIPNGIDVHYQFNHKSWEDFDLPAAAKVILFVGRLDSQKGILEFISQADRLLTALPTHQIVLMGEGPLQAQLLKLKATLIHGQRIHLVGWQASAMDWMRSAQMLVLPAKYEGMPNVILEAMLAEIPVVAFAVEGISELVGESDVQVIPPGDYAALIDALVRLGSNQQLRQYWASHNATRVKQHFRLEQQLERYSQLYANSLRQKASNSR